MLQIVTARRLPRASLSQRKLRTISVSVPSFSRTSGRLAADFTEWVLARGLWNFGFGCHAAGAHLGHFVCDKWRVVGAEGRRIIAVNGAQLNARSGEGLSQVQVNLRSGD